MASHADGDARSNLYDVITKKIIAKLEQGRLPWVQHWGASPDRPRLACREMLQPAAPIPASIF